MQSTNIRGGWHNGDCNYTSNGWIDYFVEGNNNKIVAYPQNNPLVQHNP